MIVDILRVIKEVKGWCQGGIQSVCTLQSPIPPQPNSRGRFAVKLLLLPVTVC